VKHEGDFEELLASDEELDEAGFQIRDPDPGEEHESEFLADPMERIRRPLGELIELRDIDPRASR
jgi:hypothetical protein